MTTLRNPLPYGLSGPAAMLMIAFVAIPLLMTLSLSLYGPVSHGMQHVSIGHYARVFSDPYYQGIFVRTFTLSVLVTAISILIGVPEAYVLSCLSPRWRTLSMFVVIGPLLMSVVVRTLGWTVLFGSEGLVNTMLLKTGMIHSPVRLMFTFTGILIALVHVQVPFMVLAVSTSLQKMDVATEHAAQTLGASSVTVMRRVVLPQVIPGVLSGSLIVFALTASAFATPAIIGGRRLKVVPTAIYDEILGNLNWALGTTLAVVLMMSVMVISIGIGRYVERRYKQVF